MFMRLIDKNTARFKYVVNTDTGELLPIGSEGDDFIYGWYDLDYSHYNFCKSLLKNIDTRDLEFMCGDHILRVISEVKYVSGDNSGFEEKVVLRSDNMELELYRLWRKGLHACDGHLLTFMFVYAYIIGDCVVMKMHLYDLTSDYILAGFIFLFDKNTNEFVDVGVVSAVADASSEIQFMRELSTSSGMKWFSLMGSIE